MERIDVWRGEPGLDADGNTVQGPLELVMSFDGLVAPVNTPETSSDDSHGVTWDHAIYIRSKTPTGIRDTDLIGVRAGGCPSTAWCACGRNPTARTSATSSTSD